jgi:hypothetical protein
MPVNSVWIGRIGNWICHRLVPWRDCRVDDVTLLRHFESRLFWTLLRGFVPFKRGLVMCLWAHAIGNWMSYDILSLKHFKIQDFTNPWASALVEKCPFSQLCYSRVSRDTDMLVVWVWIGRIDNWICHRSTPLKCHKIDDVIILRHRQSCNFWLCFRHFCTFQTHANAPQCVFSRWAITFGMGWCHGCAINVEMSMRYAHLY